MDYNLKYLKYKNKYINLKNLIGNGSNKQTPEEKKAQKEADAKLREDYKKTLVECKIINKFMNIFLDKLMKKELDIKNIVELSTSLKKINTDLSSYIINDILINYKSQEKEKVDFLIKILILISDMYDFEEINIWSFIKTKIINRYFKMEDYLFRIFRFIVLNTETHRIDIYCVLNDLHLLIVKCPSMVKYLQYLTTEPLPDINQHIKCVNYFLINNCDDDKIKRDYGGIFSVKENTEAKLIFMADVLVYNGFDVKEVTDYINAPERRFIKWTHLEEVIQLFKKHNQKYKEEGKNIYEFIRSKLDQKIWEDAII